MTTAVPVQTAPSITSTVSQAAKPLGGTAGDAPAQAASQTAPEAAAIPSQSLPSPAAPASDSKPEPRSEPKPEVKLAGKYTKPEALYGGIDEIEKLLGAPQGTPAAERFKDNPSAAEAHYKWLESVKGKMGKTPAADAPVADPAKADPAPSAPTEPLTLGNVLSSAGVDLGGVRAAIDGGKPLPQSEVDKIAKAMGADASKAGPLIAQMVAFYAKSSQQLAMVSAAKHVGGEERLQHLLSTVGATLEEDRKARVSSLLANPETMLEGLDVLIAHESRSTARPQTASRPMRLEGGTSALPSDEPKTAAEFAALSRAAINGDQQAIRRVMAIHDPGKYIKR